MSKISRLSFTFLIGILGFLAACEDSTEERVNRKKSPIIRKSSVLDSPKGKTKIKFGEEVLFKLRTRSEEVGIDSVRLEGLGERRVFQTQEFSWTPLQPRTGIPKIKLTVFMGEKKESHHPKIEFYTDEPPTEYSYIIKNEFPHDPQASTQGLFFKEDTLYESTGLYGFSTIRKVDLATGRVFKKLDLNEDHFGEGCAIKGDKVYQLTWRAQKALVYNLDFELINTLNYPTEGWGLTNFGENLIMSDGSENLYILDPESFTEIDRLEVYDDNGKLDEINELEYINGKIYANVWGEDYILIINPSSGVVESRINLTGIGPAESSNSNLEFSLNGIAFDQENNRLFVTGKKWDTIYEIEVVENKSS